MIDSIDLSLYPIYVDMNHLTEIGIRWTNSKDRKAIYFNYKNIKFTYYKYGSLNLVTNTHKILKKHDITLHDKVDYVMRINRYY